MSAKKRRRRLKKKVKRALWGILFTIIAVVVAVIAINYVDFSKSDKNYVPLPTFLSEINFDTDRSIECYVIQFDKGVAASEVYCDAEVRQTLEAEEYSGDCVRLLISQGKANMMEVYAITRDGNQYVVSHKLR